MVGVSRGVVTWRKIARALYSGALDNCVAFKTIADVLAYLEASYNDALEIDVNHTASKLHYRRYSNRTNLPIYVELLFTNLEYDRCVLCNGVSIVLNEQREFEYRNDVTWTEAHSDEPQSSILRRLEHLALIHTPYFLLFFVDLATDKRHVLHVDRASRLEIAQYAYNALTSVERTAEFDDDLAEKYLKMWWRYQDSRSRALFDAAVPRYVECQLSDRISWTPADDGFSERRSVPVYQFLQKCTIREVWDEVWGGSDFYETPGIVLCEEGSDACTYSLRVAIPKRQCEGYLSSLRAACENYKAPTNETFRNAHAYPKLDCFALEHVGLDETFVILHVVVTLGSRWLPLDAWVRTVPTFGLPDVKVPVASALFGALSSTYAENKRPPLEMYEASYGNIPIDNLTEAFSVHPDALNNNLAKAFFVHSDTLEVLSLLPYISIDNVYREGYSDRDDNHFRATCANVLTGVYGRDIATVDHVSDERAISWTKEELCAHGFSHGATRATIEDDRVTYGRRTSAGTEFEDGFFLRGVKDNAAVADKLSKMCCAAPFHVTLVEPNVGHTLFPESLVGLVNAIASKCEMIQVKVDARDANCKTRKRIAEIAVSEAFRDDDDDEHGPSVSYGLKFDDGNRIRFDSDDSRPSVYSPRLYLCDMSESDYETFPDPDLYTNSSRDDQIRQIAERDLYTTSSQYDQIRQIAERDLYMTLSQYDQIGQIADPDLHANSSRDDQIGQMVDEFAERWTSRPSESQETTNRTERCVSNPSESQETYRTDYDDDDDDDDVDAPDRDSLLPVMYQYVKTFVEENCDRNSLSYDTPSLDSDDEGDGRVPPNVDYGRTRVRDGDDDDRGDHAENVRGVCGDDLDERNVTSADVEGPREFERVLYAHPRWRSNGVPISALEKLRRWSEYRPMRYVTPLSTKNAHNRNTVATFVRASEPVTTPTEGLPPPPSSAKMNGSSRRHTFRVVRTDTGTRRNWRTGVYSVKPVSAKVTKTPRYVSGYERLLDRAETDCARESKTYVAVDLSRTPDAPDNASDRDALFEHTSFKVSEFPTGFNVVNVNILRVYSTHALYLGPVAIVSDVANLFSRKVFSCETFLRNVLDMHTRLQIHPFVPRVMTLQLMSVPVDGFSTVGMFTGEHPGLWSLGSPNGLRFTAQDDVRTFCYHVTTCLLRAQILTVAVLGFPFSIIQPARIWRCDDGFRLDTLSCLVDTFYAFDGGTFPSAMDGLDAVSDTLKKLSVFDALPADVRAVLSDKDPVDRDVFRRVYAYLTGTEAHTDLRDVLGGRDKQYRPFTLETAEYITEPFGPFKLQIQNQFFKWNVAILVEPITKRARVSARILRVKDNSSSHGTQHGKRTAPDGKDGVATTSSTLERAAKQHSRNVQRVPRKKP